MSELLDFPTVETVPMPAAEPVPAAQDRKNVDLQEVALAQFGNWRTDVAAARKNLSTLALDLSIPARIADAKTLRHRIINTPRAEVRKVATALKSKLTAVSKAVGVEMDAAVAAYDDAESLITPQIEAAERRIEEERQRKEREEQQRIESLKLAVDGMLDPWLDRCNAADMTADRAASGIAALGQITMPEQFADVAAYWAERVSATSRAMESRRLALAAAELEAAQAKARAEQARIAGIQQRIAEIRAAATGHEKATAADLAEARIAVAALDTSEAVYGEFAGLAEATQAATLAALDKLHGEAWEREEAAAAEVQRVLAIPLPLTIPEEPESTEGQDSQQVLKAEPATADATDRDVPANTSPSVGSMGAGQAADAAPAGGFVIVIPPESTMYAELSAPAAVEPGTTLIRGEVGRVDCGIKIVEPAPEPTLTLGKLNEWLAPVKIDAAGLELLGFQPVKVHTAKLYHEADKPAIVAALVKHLQGL